jgi:hypothetical protein
MWYSITFAEHIAQQKIKVFALSASIGYTDREKMIAAKQRQARSTNHDMGKRRCFWMYGECHAHLIMDAVNYKAAVAIHKNGPVDAVIREKLKLYQEAGITFVRDGGDAYGVSRRAAQLAPEYGIDYRTPIFAIHKNGHYGGIVGLGFNTMQEYHQRVLQVRDQEGDFIKIMCSGIMDFGGDGGVTEEPLTTEEIREMIHIAHEEGFAVMAHVNGARAVQDTVEAGADSVEHGNFMDEECLQALSESRTVWVPTLVTISNLKGSGRFSDEVIKSLELRQMRNIRRGYEIGVKIAAGSDAGAWHVPHAEGLLDELRLLEGIFSDPVPETAEDTIKILHKNSQPRSRLREAESLIRSRFCR